MFFRKDTEGKRKFKFIRRLIKHSNLYLHAINMSNNFVVRNVQNHQL